MGQVKKSGLVFLSLFVLIICGAAVPASSKEPPPLHNVTCSKWMAYEEETADQLAHIFGEHTTTSKPYLEVAKSQARNQKLGYLTCLMDVYISPPDTRSSEFEKEIDVFCSKPENKDRRIRDVFLTIYKKMRKARK